VIEDFAVWAAPKGMLLAKGLSGIHRLRARSCLTGYRARRLRVTVRDDGSGKDPDVLRFGRDGHWGLQSARSASERDSRYGAHLASGTRIELSVPRHIAYQSEPKAHRLKLSRACKEMAMMIASSQSHGAPEFRPAESELNDAARRNY